MSFFLVRLEMPVEPTVCPVASPGSFVTPVRFVFGNEREELLTVFLGVGERTANAPEERTLK